MERKESGFATRFEILRGGRSLQALSDDIKKATGKRITPQAMHKWLQGGGVKKEHLELLARYFNVTEAWLVYGEERVHNSADALTAEGLMNLLPPENARVMLDVFWLVIEANAKHFSPNDLRGLRTRWAAMREKVAAKSAISKPAPKKK